MKKIILLVFCCSSLISLQGQQEDYVWMIGRGNANSQDYTTSKIDFHQYPPKMEIVMQDFDFSAVAAIGSTPEGKLQCYSNGIDIQNAQHQFIENGAELIDYIYYPAGLTIPQGSLILPYPDHPQQYFFLTSEFLPFQYQGIGAGGVHPIYTSTIDMNKGIGEVMIRNNVLNTDTLSTGQFVATRHANGRDWWILASKFRTNKYYRYLLNNQGIQEKIPQEVGDPMRDDLGQAVFSPNGKQYARYNQDVITQKSYIDLYDFDRCEGMLSNHQRYAFNKTVPGGIAFSPNSRYLYISLWEEIWQFDLQADDIFASGILVAEYDGFRGDNQGLAYHNRFFMMQLAPDGRIYINIPNVNSKYLHVIQYPDQAGLACEVRQHFIELPAFNAFTLPNLPYYRLGPEKGTLCDSLGINIEPMAHFRFDPDPNDSLNVIFTNLSIHQTEKWKWNFGDGNTSNEKNNIHRYTEGGSYEVCLELYDDLDELIEKACDTVNLARLTSTITIETSPIKIYPNPFDKQLQIDAPVTVNKDTKIQILDALGRTVFLEAYSPALQINTTKWISGLYHYRILEKEKVMGMGKLVKK